MSKTILITSFIVYILVTATYSESSAQSFDSLKAALGHPKKVTSLTLKDRDARLKKIPAEIKKLQNLKALQIICLSHLEALPEEIGSLSKLEKLIVESTNKCRMNISVPASLGRLKNLTVLKLSGIMGQGDAGDTALRKKPAAVLPESISQLKNLRELDLGRNGLSEVPPQIKGLEKLERLLLDNNNFASIPSFIGSLRKLRELSLVSTAVTSLPAELSTIKGLRISMDGSRISAEERETLKSRFPQAVFSFSGGLSNKPSSPEPQRTVRDYLQTPNYRAIFATGLNENNEPVNNLTQVSMDDGIIYLYVMWYLIPRDKYHYQCRIYDGAGDLVWQTYMDFSPTDSSHYTFSSYQMRRNIDKPGQWKFEILLNGTKVIEKNITVLSGAEAKEKQKTGYL